MPDPAPAFPVLVLGGTRSGKSRWAERLAAEAAAHTGQPVCYLATAEPLDGEMADRIDAHRQRRPHEWVTLEEPLAAAEAIRRWSATHVVLVECLTLLLSNWMRDPLGSASFAQRADALAAAVAQSPSPVIVVSNEVGAGIVPMYPMARQYADWLGLLNQRVARASARVYLTVAGRPLLLPPDPGET